MIESRLEYAKNMHKIVNLCNIISDHEVKNADVKKIVSAILFSPFLVSLFAHLALQWRRQTPQQTSFLKKIIRHAEHIDISFRMWNKFATRDTWPSQFSIFGPLKNVGVRPFARAKAISLQLTRIHSFFFFYSFLVDAEIGKRL